MINSSFLLPLETNPILKTDSYKFSHPLQLRKNTQFLSSYIEARGFKEGYAPYTVAMGMNRYANTDLSIPFTSEHIKDAETFCRMHNEPFDKAGYEYILAEYAGYWPVNIRAVPEGTVVPISNVTAQLVNTDSKVPWVASMLETSALRNEWTASTVATICSNIRTEFVKYYELTSSVSDISNAIDYKLHDFGSRGTSDPKVGIGHLCIFKGSDNVEAIASVMDNYHCDSIPATSVPAAEHSTITSWGRSNEIAAYENMIEKFGGPGKIYSAPVDSYNMTYALDVIIGTRLKDAIIRRGGTFVARLDSGVPIESILEALDILSLRFGFSVNAKGYKVLPSCIRILQGDGIDLFAIRSILATMAEKKWSIDNIVFGAGGALLQHMDRDWFGWAMKCSATMIDDHWIDVYKDPANQSSKRSKRGRLMLVKDRRTCGLVTFRATESMTDILVPIYHNGKILNKPTWEEVRNNYISSMDDWLISQSPEETEVIDVRNVN